jgi:hypothetical protein
MSVSLVEFLWVMLNTITLVFTITALVDARADREAVRLLNGKARELAASGIVRREMVRVIVQVLLLSIAVPGLFSDRETALSPVVAALMAVPLFLLLSSFWDARERKAMTVIVTAEALTVKTDALERIERKVEAGAEAAHQAYKVANDINVKIAAQQQAGLAQGEAAASVTETA